MNHSQTISEILLRAAQAKIAELTEQVILNVGRVVQGGPFKGMKLPETASWGNGDLLPKILGTYEQELNVSIETCISRKPEVVVNIGCAEGYYAVGLALRMPDVMVYSYDSDSTALTVCATAAEINLAKRVAIPTGGPSQVYSDIYDLRDMRSLYVIDCEGAELEYVKNPANFKNADLIIECHDFTEVNTAQKLTERLSATHEIAVLREGYRDPSAIELLSGLNTMERYACLCEMRPRLMFWVVALAKSRS